MSKDTFVFHKDWKEAISDLPDDIRLEIYESVIEYATSGNVKGLKTMASIAFNFIKTTIDRDAEKYISIVNRNRRNGSFGGKPKKITQEISKNPMGILKTEKKPKKPKKPDNDSEYDNEYDNDFNTISNDLEIVGISAIFH